MIPEAAAPSHAMFGTDMEGNEYSNHSSGRRENDVFAISLSKTGFFHDRITEFSRNSLLKSLKFLVFDDFEGKFAQTTGFRAQIL